MSYTLSDAVGLLAELEKRTENSNLASAKSALNDLMPILGENKVLEDSLSGIFEEGRKKYDTRAISGGTFETSQFNLWAEKVAKAVLTYKTECCEKIQGIHDTYVAAESFLGKSLEKRKKIALGFCIAFIVLSAITAAVAIFGFLRYREQWGENLAGVLGIIDFSVGVCGIFIERISDMKEQKISRAMEGIMRTSPDELDKAKEYADSIKVVIKKVVIKDSIVGNNNKFYNCTANHIEDLTINESSTDTKNTTDKEVHHWEEELQWWIKR